MWIQSIFDQLNWWQCPLFMILVTLIVVVFAKLFFGLFISIPINIVKQRQEGTASRRDGLRYTFLGLGMIVISVSITWLFYQIEDQSTHTTVILCGTGAIAVGTYQLLYGLGLLLFRSGVVGVMFLIYSIILYIFYLIWQCF